MKTIYIIFSFILLSVGLNAQRNYRPGYIITNNNDSIMGWIDFRTDKMNGESCWFKKTEKGEEQVFYPGDIAKYRFIDEGKYYVSYKIDIDNISKTVFLEYLLQGMMDLYYYYDNSRELDYYFFLNPKDNKMISLTKKPDEIVDYQIKEDGKYKNILSYLFAEYPSMKNDLNRASFNRKTFVELTKEYHDLTCTSGESCIIFENDYRKRFMKIELSAYAGMQLADYSLTTDDYRFESMKCAYPVIGGQISLSNPRWSRWISLQADLSLSALKGRGEYLWGSNYSRYDYKAMMGTGKLDVRYIIPLNSKFRPVIQGGFSYISLFNTSSSLYIEERYGETADIEELKDYLLPPNTFFGFNVAIGLNYLTKNDKYFFGQILYEGDKGIDGDHKVKIFQLKVGYAF